MLGELLAKIEAIQAEARQRIASLKTLQEWQEAKAQILGRNGSLTQILRSLGELSPQERPVAGQKVNQAKQEIENSLQAIQENLAREKERRVLQSQAVDETLPGLDFPRGRRHPIAQVMEEIEEIFLGLGFSIYEGPEVESDYYNFEALNFPQEHPARDMQDTFYTKSGGLLRTHTSPVQIRVMEKKKPPLYMIAPGVVYRHDNDVTHSPMFHQVEGLMVDTDITLGDLKGVLELFCKAVFGPQREVRFRPSFFPFVEPGAEVDIACALCRQKPHHLSHAKGVGPLGANGQVVGKGCRICGNGWLEILGAGMVHPAVLERVKINPKKYSGFAFGMGVERIAMLKYGIDDIRLFYESDLRFLEQF